MVLRRLVSLTTVGRPPPTVEEARAEALDRLVSKAIRVLEAHLDSGRHAWPVPLDRWAGRVAPGTAHRQFPWF